MANVFNFFAKPEALIAPAVKVNATNVANLEKLVNFQQRVLPAYTDLGLARIKAAVEVSDVKGLQTFYKDQVEVAKVLNQTLVEDGKALVELLSDIAGEYNALIKNSVTGRAPAGLKRAA